MDRSRAVLIAGLAIGLACVIALGGAGPSAPLPSEIRWLAPGTDRIEALLFEPASCYSPAREPETRALEQIGRAVFASPSLLGGQAARAGLSCASCHSGGRTNPHFFFPGLSGAPGTADVTTSLLSEKRGDGQANPIPIPDLAAARSALKISREDDAALQAFIRGLIVEEFAGPEPAPRVLQGLAAYVRAITPQACPAQSRQALTPAGAIETVLDSVRAADAALAEKESAVAISLLAAARAGLGRLSERFPAEGDAHVRARLSAASQALAQARELAQSDPAQARWQITVFLAGTPQWADPVLAAAPHSLFDAETIRAWFSLAPS